MNDAINVDKNIFKRIFLYGIMFYISFFILIQLFGAVSAPISSKIASAAGVADITDISAGKLDGYSSQISEFLFLFILVGVIFMLALAYTYSFFENKIWNAIFDKKTDFKNTSRFLGLNLLLAIVFSVVLLALFSFIARFLYGVPKLGTVIFFFSVLFSVYLLFVGYWSFGKTHSVLKSIKNVYLIGIKRLDLTIVELVTASVILILLNLALLLFSWIPEPLYLALSIIGLLFYVSWFRLYLTNALKPVKV